MTTTSKPPSTQRETASPAKRVALIVGAGSGVGAEAAKAFAADHTVLLSGPHEQKLTRVANTIVAQGGEASTVEADASRPGDIDAIERRVAELGGLAVLVNCAGVSLCGHMLPQLPDADWSRSFSVNVDSTYYLAKRFLPALAQGDGGSLITVGSVASVSAAPASAAYCASKAALLMLTQCIAVDHGADGVRANCILPGWVETPMADHEMDMLASERGVDRAAAYSLATRNVPAGRPSRPDEIAAVARFLASDSASYITGAALVVDGGAMCLWSGTTAFYPGGS